ncbi:hypothetical protein RAC89_13905 [Paenibacillus sp. GD4]|uniref:hypothetical protein n=1 Tax=Paenibacillus sp. GD4 TaxID=3068890 RepID=UPI00279669E1|nr:hypothetical protein [Paenibacillus sp. GD4]MDQ1911527.1 hypothetical protein [Paenibacillus sp. GD4]
MQAISPIHAEAISPYIGRQVCAVLHDGSRIYGTITGVDGGHFFAGRSYARSLHTLYERKKAKSQIINRNKAKAKTKAFGYPFGGAYALSLALISLLFLVPFFWV